MAEFDVWELKCGYQYSDSHVFANAADFLRNGRLSVQCIDSDTTDADACSDGSRYAVNADWLGKGETNTSGDNDDDEVSFEVIP
jgi:hypothetical protein